MSALERLKARLAKSPTTPFVGFEGGSITGFPRKDDLKLAFDGFEGNLSEGGSRISTSSGSKSKSEICLPDPPSKPSEGRALPDTDATNDLVRTAVSTQTNVNACWVCAGRETLGRMFIAVCSDGASHFWMHADCWPEHVSRIAAARAFATEKEGQHHGRR